MKFRTPFAPPYFKYYLVAIEDYYPVPNVSLIPAVAECPHTQTAESHRFECVFEHRSIAFLVYI